jgi:hypothetical protein
VVNYIKILIKWPSREAVFPLQIKQNKGMLKNLELYMNPKKTLTYNKPEYKASGMKFSKCKNFQIFKKSELRICKLEYELR